MSSTGSREPRVPVKGEADQSCQSERPQLVQPVPEFNFPRETPLRYTPWLVVRYADGDDGSRPMPAGEEQWKSPDLWVVSSAGIDQPVPGEENRVFARVSNLGFQDATGVIVKFWWASPSLAITAPYVIGTGYANIQSGDSVVVECPTKWVPDVANGGHQCLLVEAFIPAFDDLTAPLDPWDDRHVGQKNEQLVMLAPGESFSTNVQAANPFGIAQVLTFEVRPSRRAAVHPLLAARARNLPADLLPPSSALPLSFKLDDSPALFTGPSAVFARRLLSQTLREVAGTAKYCSAPAQITRTAHFEPWEARMIEVTGRVPPDARPGQTYSFNIVQRAGLMITGGYTVNVVVAAQSRRGKERL
jgi:hypothetical protein